MAVSFEDERGGQGKERERKREKERERERERGRERNETFGRKHDKLL
jgi:hypothetical protein